jgi:endoribonuclease Dicer
MTASPIDAKGDVVKAARLVVLLSLRRNSITDKRCRTLEMLLDSQIATTSNLTLLRQVVSRPTEQVWTYPRLDPPCKTALYECMESRFGDMGCLAKIFKFALNASPELGEWCSDRVWTYALAEEVLPKLQGSVSRVLNRSIQNGSMERVEKEINRLKEACEVVATYRLRNHDISRQLSPKVQLLREELSKQFQSAENTKCIVFTKQRHTARLLGDLFTSLDLPNLRPGILIGVRSGDDAGMNTTYHQQFKTMMRFRKGELNCLV